MTTEDDLLDGLVDDLLTKEATTRRDHHIQLHRKWIDGGKNPEDLKPLLGAFQGHINNRTNELSGGNLTNQDAVRLSVTKRAVEAFETYDPSRGVALNTHVQNHTIGALRDVIKSQNIGRIPEETALQIGKVDRERAIFEDEHGRPPTPEELAPRVGISLPMLKRLQRSRVSDLSSGGFEVSVVNAHSDRDRQNLPLIAMAIPRGTTEHQVFTALYGEDGMGGSAVRTQDLSKKLGKSEHDIAKAKSSIAKRIQGAR